jgi:hypothetical protein
MKRRFHAAGICDCCDAPEQEELFDVSQTVHTACPAGHCQAIRQPGQQKVITCAHDLEQDPRGRPRGCLNAYDPATAPLPHGF